MSPEFSAFVQTLLLWTVPALAASAVVFAVSAGVGAYNAWKARNMAAAAALEQAVAMAVKAAEQTGLKNQWVNAGKEKYNLAFEFAQALLEKQGLRLDGKLIGGAIEAAVLDAFNKPAA